MSVYLVFLTGNFPVMRGVFSSKGSAKIYCESMAGDDAHWEQGHLFLPVGEDYFVEYYYIEQHKVRE